MVMAVVTYVLVVAVCQMMAMVILKVMGRFAMQDWMLVQNSTMNSRTTNFFSLAIFCMSLSLRVSPIYFWVLSINLCACGDGIFVETINWNGGNGLLLTTDLDYTIYSDVKQLLWRMPYLSLVLGFSTISSWFLR